VARARPFELDVDPLPTPAPAPAWSLPAYLAATRRSSFNVVWVVGLLVVYEVGMLLSGETRRNAADVLLKRVLEGFGPAAPAVFHGGLLVLLVAVGWRGLARGEPSLSYCVPFAIECALYAALLSPFVLFLRLPFLAAGGHGDVLLDLGAGVYEEILFRWLLVQVPFLCLRFDPWRRRTGPAGAPGIGGQAVAAAAIVVGAALAFAAYHHVGPGGDALEPAVFGFRFLAAIVLSLVFLLRGLAVAVYTHAAYDLLVHGLAP